jgi:hypothetical protein
LASLIAFVGAVHEQGQPCRASVPVAGTRKISDSPVRYFAGYSHAAEQAKLAESLVSPEPLYFATCG